MKCFVDTSVLVASLVREHGHHARAMPVIRRIVGGQDQGIVAAHSLAEVYAVLTTLPVSPRIGPDTAEKLMRDNVLASFEVVALTAREYAQFVTSLADRMVVGGSVYDALILAAALKSAADRVYTFNVTDFVRLAPELRDRIVAP